MHPTVVRSGAAWLGGTVEGSVSSALLIGHGVIKLYRLALLDVWIVPTRESKACLPPLPLGLDNRPPQTARLDILAVWREIFVFEAAELPVLLEQVLIDVDVVVASGPPRVATGLRDLHGNEVTVACSTCHSTRPPNHRNTVADDFDEFHRGMTFSHGTVSCLSCHNERDYDTLKLADGSRVDYADVKRLCAQCHGPQMKAYEHGAHGGMNGYWDSSRGPQQKNNCVDCHRPHAPQFPKMQPTFKPRDRFLDPPRTDH